MISARTLVKDLTERQVFINHLSCEENIDRFNELRTHLVSLDEKKEEVFQKTVDYLLKLVKPILITIESKHCVFLSAQIEASNKYIEKRKMKPVDLPEPSEKENS